MKILASSALLVVVLTGCSASETKQSEDVSVDWAKTYDDAQNEHSFDYLLSCWADQWPDGVKPAEGQTAATAGQIEAAIHATRERCGLPMKVRLDQINVDLARQGMVPAQIETAAPKQLETELVDMFDEYWSRL